jgi:hypothetical protein
MDTKEIVNSILETVRTEITDFVKLDTTSGCPIEYEKRVIDIARNLSKSLILGAQGGLPKSRNFKKKY